MPTRPIDDAGPLNGKTPPILISVAVTPGASAAKAGADSASISADASVTLPSMTSSSVERRSVLVPERTELFLGKLQFFFRTSQAFLTILDPAASSKPGIRVLKAKGCGCDFKRMAGVDCRLEVGAFPRIICPQASALASPRTNAGGNWRAVAASPIPQSTHSI